jgi:hypothetical protein
MALEIKLTWLACPNPHQFGEYPWRHCTDEDTGFHLDHIVRKYYRVSPDGMEGEAARARPQYAAASRHSPLPQSRRASRESRCPSATPVLSLTNFTSIRRKACGSNLGACHPQPNRSNLPVRSGRRFLRLLDRATQKRPGRRREERTSVRTSWRLRRIISDGRATLLL